MEGWWLYQFHPQWQLVSSVCKMTVSWAEGTLLWRRVLRKGMLNLSYDYERHIGDRWGSVYHTWGVPSGLCGKQKIRGRTSCTQALWPQSLLPLLGWIAFDVWITTNCGKFLKRWEYQTTWPASWEICRQVKKQQLELDMEHQTGSKLGKKCFKAEYYPPAYLTEHIMHNGWSTSWNQDCREKYQ